MQSINHKEYYHVYVNYLLKYVIFHRNKNNLLVIFHILVFQIGMGWTARKSKSPYVAANRTSRSRFARNSPAFEAVIYQRTGGGNVQQRQQQSAGDNQQPSGAECSQQYGSATRGVTIHFFHKRYILRYLICITIRFKGNCNYSLKSMLVDMGAAMLFFYMRSLTY